MTATLEAFTQSTLSAFTRSTLGERDASSTNSVITMDLGSWQDGTLYTRFDNPFGTQVAEACGSDFSGWRDIGIMRNTVNTAWRNRIRNIRRRVFDATATQSMVNPQPSLTPASIQWSFYFEDYDLNFSPSLNVYAVSVNSNSQNVSNYHSFAVQLASVAVSTFTKHAYNTVNLNVATYLANIVDASWCFLIASASDAAGIDPGISAATPNAIFRIRGTIGGGLFKDTLTFNY